ncbi:MAG: pentapeptide repeat-containing protein [Desulfovibrio sp.]|nr:pentapeptide repeat-containing protein [Desulfovibrio sp.]
MNTDGIDDLLSFTAQAAWWQGHLYQACTFGLGFDLRSSKPVPSEVVWAAAMNCLEPGQVMDLGQPKEEAEWLVAGFACAPFGSSVTKLVVEMRFGTHVRKLLVYDEAPFFAMPLSWKKTWAGKEENPDGLPQNQLRRANISDADSPFGTPACPGPRGDWPCRTKYLGTCDKAWLEKDWPMPPADMSRAFFNLAQPCQRLPEGLRGDETFEFRGLHPELACISGHLPGKSLQLLVEREDGVHEHDVSPDTVFFFPNQLLGIIFWRAMVACDDEAGAGITALSVTLLPAEPASEPEKDEEKKPEEKPFDAPLESKKPNADDVAAEKAFGVPEPEAPSAAPSMPEDLPNLTAAPKAPFVAPTPYQSLFSKELSDSLEEMNAGLAEAGFPKLTPAQVAETQKHLDHLAEHLTALEAKAQDYKAPELSSVLKKIGLSEAECKNVQAALDLPLPDPALSRNAAEWQRQVEAYLASYQGLMHPPQGLLDGLRSSLLLNGPGGAEAVAKLPKQNPAEILEEFEMSREKTQSFLALLESDLPDEPEALRAFTASLEEAAGFPKGSVAPPMTAKEAFALANIPYPQVQASQAESVTMQAKDTLPHTETPAAAAKAMAAKTPANGACEAQDALSGRELVIALLARGESLAGRDFSGFDLEGFDFSGLDLSMTKFSVVKLRQARFDGCKLSGAILADADCAQASFAGADLSGAKLLGACLTEADCTGAVFVGADLRALSAQDADFSEALFDQAVLEKADFSRASLRQTKGKDLVAREAFFVETRFEEAVFAKACFAGADFSGADVHGCQLEGADFRQARLARASFCYGTNVCSANFSRAVLEGAVWTQVAGDLGLFVGVQAVGATFSDSSFRHSVWTGSDLREADFSRSQLEGADLRGVNLFEASLREAGLEGVSFARASLYGVDLALARTNVATIFDGADISNTILAARTKR